MSITLTSSHLLDLKSPLALEVTNNVSTPNRAQTLKTLTTSSGNITANDSIVISKLNTVLDILAPNSIKC